MDNEESVRRWRAGAIITGIVAVIGVFSLVLWGTALFTTNTDGKGPIGEVPDDIRSLIANPPVFDCVAAATQYGLPTTVIDGDVKVVLTYIPNKTGPEVNQRDFSDAVNISAIPAERDRISASICSQPEQAGMVGVALLAHYPILGELNPNLFGQFEGTTPKKWADSVLSGKTPYEDAAKTMSLLAGLTEIFEVSYEKGLQTAWNYHSMPEALTTKADVRPIVENPDNYTGDFLKYRITWKGLVGCSIEFGFNVGIDGDISRGDQRIAGFTCETPPTTSPPVVIPPPEQPCVNDCEEGDKDANTGVTRNWVEDHTVNNNDGATNSQGLQGDPVADAAAAENAAAAEAAAQKAKHDNAVSDDVVVNEVIPAGPVNLD